VNSPDENSGAAFAQQDAIHKTIMKVRFGRHRTASLIAELPSHPV
jgi:hypothetical protein